MAITKKINALFRLMELFLTQKEISSYDKNILNEFGCDRKTLERYLSEIESMYGHIITIKQGHKKSWKLIRVSDIFSEFIENSDDISHLFWMANEFNSEIFKELETSTLSRISKSDKNVFLFKNSIMEEIEDKKRNQIFKNLKSAIRNHEYRDIIYNYNEERYEKNIKCLKLVFMNNNWYLALIDENAKLKFRRLSFIQEVRYASKNSFQKKDIKPYLEFLKNVQNSMTLYGVTPKVATIKATSTIAKYFEPNMKKFLPSQQFKKRCNDGGVIFTVSYTQELEILPFVQKWLPDLIILEPKELRKAYIKKLNATLGNYLS